MKNVKEIIYDNKLIAIIVRVGFSSRGIKFFTAPDSSQQLAYINHPKGHLISPHVHNPIPRKIIFTREVIFVKSGKLKVDFYYNKNKYLESIILKAGDIAFISSGGHGFKFLEDSEIFEVKQGPYFKRKDLTRFEPGGRKIKPRRKNDSYK
jgi:mannose-6-phosphate isomerase-like protein (cupin superfamily)